MTTTRKKRTRKSTTSTGFKPLTGEELKAKAEEIISTEVKKVTTPPVKRVNKVTQPKVKKVAEVTETPVNKDLDLQKLVKDYPRDGFALALLPLLLLEALTKEGLKLAGVNI